MPTKSQKAAAKKRQERARRKRQQKAGKKQFGSSNKGTVKTEEIKKDGKYVDHPVYGKLRY